MSTNLKNEQAAKKLPLHLVPPALVEETSLAFADGAKKYEPYNWRDGGVSASVYYAAALRHLQAYWDGEDISADARVSHLAHVAACMAILLDAERAGVLNDDRPKAVKDKFPEQVESAGKDTYSGETIKGTGYSNSPSGIMIAPSEDFYYQDWNVNIKKDNIFNGGDL